LRVRVAERAPISTIPAGEERLLFSRVCRKKKQPIIYTCSHPREVDLYQKHSAHTDFDSDPARKKKTLQTRGDRERKREKGRKRRKTPGWRALGTGREKKVFALRCGGEGQPRGRHACNPERMGEGLDGDGERVLLLTEKRRTDHVDAELQRRKGKECRVGCAPF